MATNNKIPKCPPLRFPDFNDDWKETSLGELLSFYPTNSYSWDQLDYETGAIYNVHYGLIHKGLPTICSPNKVKLPLIKEDLDVNKYMMCKAGDLIIADASEDTNDVGKAIEIIECENKEVVAGLHTIHARSKQDTTSLGFKGYLFASKNLKGQIRQVAQGTKVYSISAKLLSPLIISLPSLAEQKKIADFLSLIDERIQSCSEAIKELKTQKAALLNQLFSQKLRFPDFNDEWRVTTLGEICTIKTGKLDANAMVEKGRYPFFTCSKDVYKTDSYAFDGEAILIAGNGDIGLSKFYIGKFNAYQRTYVLQDFKKIASLFLKHQIDCFLPNRVQVYKNNGAMPYITLGVLLEMPISLPTLEEQKKIADFLSLIDERIEVEELLLNKYEEQKKYLLRKMFV